MARKNGGGHPPIYKSYVFRDKDPAIDELRTLTEKHFGRRINAQDLAHIAESGGPTVGCMRSWFFGITKRPTNPTLEAAGRAMGYERVWRRQQRNVKSEDKG
jgi:hypothetical protein